MKKLLLPLACAVMALSSAGNSTPSYIPENIQDGVILHCFVWPLRDVIDELPNIANAGFTAVQISPMQAPNVAGQPWYYTYGPIDYAFYEGALGTRADLIELCEKADNYGIKIIMDVCANHMMADGANKWRAPEQYTVDWWRTDGRAISEQGEVRWDSRWSMTQQNIFGMEVATSRSDVQQRMRDYLADLYSMGVRGIRWDSAKHIAVPSEGDNFWPSVIKDCGMWTYAEILGDINYAPELMGEYIDLMSVTDITFNGWDSKSWQYSGKMPRTRSVYWSESHDTFSNGQDDSQKTPQHDIDRRWALVSSRKGASALYFSRPELLPKDDIKLAVKGSTHFTAPEVSEVNKFHNFMGAEPEEFYIYSGVAAVYRRKGVVIVTEKPGKVEIPVKNLITGLHYTDHVGGTEFTISGDKMVGEVGESCIAVVYDASELTAPAAAVSIWPETMSFTTQTATYTLTPAYCTKATVRINGANPIEISEPTKFTIGEDTDFEKDIKIEWQGGEGDRAASGEYVITKIDPNPTYVFLRSDADWSRLKAYTFIYDSTGLIGAWPGIEMTFNPDITIDGKSDWWVCEIPEKYKLTGMAMVSTSGKYRYPDNGEPGIPVEGKSIAFEYISGEWQTSLLNHSDISGLDSFIEVTGDLPKATWGKVHRFNTHSPQLDANFIVDVLLPEGYDPNREEGYPVVYANDGQGLYDGSFAHTGHSWNLDVTLEKLAKKELIYEPIIVGINNRGTLRPSDYIPEKPCTEYIPEQQRQASGMWTITNNTMNADEYIEFIATTLKSHIDRTFNTAPDRTHTFVMGSSMGALSALYAMCEYPDVFGGAACLSTHWIGDFNYDNTLFPEAMLGYLKDHLPSAENHKLYLDRGTIDLDAAYAPWEPKAHALAQEKGYNISDGSLLTHTDEGASHNEIAWAARVDRPLYFLLGRPNTEYEPDLVETEEYHVMFRDNRYPWATPTVFTWSEKTGVLHLGNWPGRRMTQVYYDSQYIWEIKFTHSDAPTHIIFNDGNATGAVQTADLPFHNNYVYSFDGPVSPLTSSIEEATSDSDISVEVAAGEIIIDAATPMLMTISSVAGHSETVKLSSGKNRIPVGTSGIYILHGDGFTARKVAVMP